MGVTILTPDGKHDFRLYMYNEKGEILSNALIERSMHRPDVKWRKWKKRHELLDGKAAPVVLYVFADPFCPLWQFWQQAFVRGSNPAGTITHITGRRD